MILNGCSGDKMEILQLGTSASKFYISVVNVLNYLPPLVYPIITRHNSVQLRGQIKASGKLGLYRVVSFGLHLSLHIEPGRVDRVTATHISKQQLSSAPQLHINISAPVNIM